MQGIDGLIKFQRDRLLNKQEYNHLNEHVNIVEELFESLGYDVPETERIALMYDFEQFIETEVDNNVAYKKEEEFSENEIVDAYGDIITFAVGAIMKLGYDPKLVLKEVSKEINSRTGSIQNGKFEKFKPSEPGYKEPYKAVFSTCRYHKD